MSDRTTQPGEEAVALLPCPFCGSAAEIERYGDRRQSTIYRCTSCSCSLETGEEWSHGRDWNERSPASGGVDAVGARLNEKALEAACEAVLVVPDHPGDKQKIRDAIATYIKADLKERAR